MFEKKRGTRFLASVMALVMLLSLAPVGALAVEDEEQNQDVVTLPADGDNQKAVVMNEENTENTNEEPTPPPRNEGDAIIPTDNNNASTAISEAEIIPDEKMFDEAFGMNPDASNSNDIAEHKGGNKGDREPVTTDSTTKYVIRFYVSNTGTKNSYTEQNKYGIDGQPNSTIDGAEGGDTVKIMVSPDYAILTQCNDVAKGISTEEFKAVEVTGDTDVRAWLNKYAEKKVPGELTDRNNVNAIVNFVNTQYNNSGKNLPTLNANDFNGFRFVDAHYVNSGECSIHVHVQLIKENQYIVQYNPNGGSGAMVDENLYFPGDQATVKANEFTRTGYTFADWNTDENGNGTSYDLTDTITIEKANVTLYAQWTANTHKVTYTDGANGTVFSNVEKTGTYGEAIPKYSDENANPTRSGYTFKGWTSSVSGITPDSVMPDQEVTFTATWEEEQTTEPENPTSEIDAKYFVLTPSMTAPTDGSDQGDGNYFPNDSDCGGVEGKTTSTGYPGKIKSTLLNAYPAVNTPAGYADTTNGISADYLVLPDDLGYFSTAHYGTDGVYIGYNKDKFPDVLKNLVGEGNQFNMNHYQIVWYVAKQQKDGYHVDGYLKGVSIQLKYIDTFGGTKTEVKNVSNLESGDTVTIEDQNIITTTADRTGWIFEGWTTNADGTGKLYTAGEKETLITSTNLYAKWTASYKVVTHFMDANGIEKENLRQTSNDLTGTHGELLSKLVVKPDMTNITGTYVYVPSETSYSVDKVDKGKVGDATYTKANTVIHQYYYLDETGKIGKDEENKPTDKPDGIPDAWQYKVTFQVVNGSWNDKTNEAIVKYVTKKDAAGKDSATGTATLADVPAVGNEPNSGYRASGSWDKSLSADLKITGDTEFTFTYSRRSSGGSSRPSTPTVTIPDDVPTGLNGKDHYAYIIGYGNNDVRPQNNITRAEVATIFFRLLTDETREANMTKSNSYNDVKDGDWFCCAVSTLSKMGIIKGYEDGSFKPNDPISRAEFAAIAARFDPDGDKTPASFADVTSHWAKDEISIAANHGWIKGYEDGSFKPDQKITRAETMTLVNRVLNRLPETKDDLHKDMKTWVDNMDETAWYYLAVQEATNSHYFKNKTGTKFEQWTDLRDTRDWSELEK